MSLSNSQLNCTIVLDDVWDCASTWQLLLLRAHASALQRSPARSRPLHPLPRTAPKHQLVEYYRNGKIDSCRGVYSDMTKCLKVGHLPHCPHPRLSLSLTASAPCNRTTAAARPRPSRWRKRARC